MDGWAYLFTYPFRESFVSVGGTMKPIGKSQNITDKKQTQYYSYSWHPIASSKHRQHSNTDNNNTTQTPSKTLCIWYFSGIGVPFYRSELYIMT